MFNWYPSFLWYNLNSKRNYNDATQTKTLKKKLNMDENTEENAETPVKNDLSAAEMRAFERQTEVRLREKKLRDLLSPLESFIMSVQSLLVWEKPARSAVMVLCVNGLFWWVREHGWLDFSLFMFRPILFLGPMQ